MKANRNSMKEADKKWVRRCLNRCLGELGPHLLAVSRGAEEQDSSVGVAHLLLARAVITEAINALTPSTATTRGAA